MLSLSGRRSCRAVGASLAVVAAVAVVASLAVVAAVAAVTSGVASWEQGLPAAGAGRGQGV